jgi:DNA-binding winged helix-turn-helix (wHTH) protein
VLKNFSKAAQEAEPMPVTVSADIFLFEDFRLDRRSGVLFRRDQHDVFAPLAVGRRALDVLGVLVEQAGDLISRDEVLNAVWPGTVVEDGNLSVQISTLRSVLDNGRPEGSLIQTVPGGGYRFVGQVTRPEPNSASAAQALASPTPTSFEAADIGQPVSPSPRRRTARAVLVFVMVLCLAGLGWVVFLTSDYRWFDKATPSTPRLSIVVLPFNNLSKDPEQQYLWMGSPTI